MTERTLPPFPVDDFTLTQLEHALGTSVGYDDQGERITVGGEFTLTQFLDFMSGHDPERKTLLGYTSGIFGDGDIPIYEHLDQCYSVDDVIRALIARVRELES